MSKHSRSHYDDDDYYDDDDDMYDEWDDAPAAKPAAKAPAKVPGGKNTQPPSQTKLPTETPAQQASAKKAGLGPVAPSPGTAKRDFVAEVDAGDAEREVLLSVLPQVKAVVGTVVSDATIVQTLRRFNYDADAAVNALLTEDMDDSAAAAPSQPGAALPRVQSLADALNTREAREAIVMPKKGKATKLTIGTSSPSPQAVSPAASNAATAGGASPQPEPSGAASPVGKSAVASPTGQQLAHVYFPTSEAKEAVHTADDDGKLNISLVMAGHVDTGKSTILGHLLVKLGHYTDREVAKLEAQAKREGKQSFHFAWILDQSEEERRRGVTIDSGVHSFETDNRRVSVLDAPGHKDYVSSMISSAAQADIALFTVSASTGEFESGLNNMTKEHLAVIRTLGLPNIVVLVNKMDTVDYSQQRFDEVCAKVAELAKSLKFRDGVIAGFCPISGYQAVNLIPGTAREHMPWYDGPSLVEYVDRCEPAKRMANYPLRFVVTDVAKQVLTGKVETGKVAVGDHCVIVPSGCKVVVRAIERALVGSVKEAQAGTTVDITVSGELIDVIAGDVLCPPKQRCPVSSTCEAHVQLFANLPKVVLPGTKMLLQMHAVTVMATVKRLLKKIDPATGTWSAVRMVKCLPAESQGLIEFEFPRAMPLELAEDNRCLGRFVLRLEDETVGGGLIRALPNMPQAPAS